MRDWPPCEACGERNGLPHPGSTSTDPARAGFRLANGKMLLVCQRCYYRMNYRRKRGLDPTTGRIRLTKRERERRAQRRRIERCPLCALAHGPIPKGANRQPKESLMTIGGADIRVCHPCYHWAKQNQALILTLNLDALRRQRKEMAQTYYGRCRPCDWKTFWLAKRGAS